MQVHATFRPRRQPGCEVTLPPGSTVRDLLRVTGQGVDSTVVVRAGIPIADSAQLEEGDRLMLISSFSGG